jgi:hypothetical protein
MDASHPPIHYGPVWPTAEQRAAHGHLWGDFSLCKAKEGVTLSTHLPWISCPKCRELLQLPQAEVAKEAPAALPSGPQQGVLL